MEDGIAAPATNRLGGIPAFYAAIWEAVGAAAARWHLAIVAEAAMVVAWFVIRTTASIDGRAYAAWVVGLGLLALVAPMSGLVVFVASSVFYEPDQLPRAVPLRELVLVPLAVGVLLRIVADRFRLRPTLAIWLALLLVVGTALGVLNTFERFPNDFAWGAARSWLNNMAAPAILLVAAAWGARAGSTRIVVVACGVAVVSALVCLAEFASPGVVSGSQFAWFGFWKDFGARLSGTIPSPNALSAQLIVPTMALAAALLLVRDLRLKLVAGLALLPLVLAHYLTFSRAPLLGAYVFAIVVAWRFRRWLGIAVLVGGLVVGGALLPTYLQLRGNSVTEGATTPGSILVASDAFRFRAWGAAVSMWRDEPVIGQGYLAYKQLADVYGDPVLGSPHNEWLRFFAEEGTVVGVLALGFVAATAWALARLPGWLGTGLLAGFLAYVVAASFNNPFLFLRVSAVAFPLIGVGLALAERARSPAAVPDEPAAAEADAPTVP